MERSYQKSGADHAASKPSSHPKQHHGDRGDNQSQQTYYRRANQTGLPDSLKNQLEMRSGYDLSDLRVHHNSSLPNNMNAQAYTQGSNIFLASGKEHLLAHETWHAVQQKQGRVQPSSAQNAINMDAHLEQEADTALALPAAGRSALQQASAPGSSIQLAPNQEGTCDPQTLLDEVRQLEAQGVGRDEILGRIRDAHGGNVNRYFYTNRYGWVDIRHFGAAGSISQSAGSVAAETLGFGNEILQWATEWGDSYRSGFSPEDIPSNAAGGEFGDDYSNDEELLSDSLQRWMDDAGAQPANSPSAAVNELPATDPSAHGGDDRGSSNVSRTQSTVSGEVNDAENDWNRFWRNMENPEYWMRLYGN